MVNSKKIYVYPSYYLRISVDEIIHCIQQVITNELLPTLENEGDLNKKRSTFVLLVWVRDLF